MSVMGVQARPEIGAPDKMIAAMSLDASTKKTNPPSAQNDNGQRRPGRDARLPDGDLRHLLRAREGRNERDEHWAVSFFLSISNLPFFYFLFFM